MLAIQVLPLTLLNAHLIQNLTVDLPALTNFHINLPPTNAKSIDVFMSCAVLRFLFLRGLLARERLPMQ